MALDVKSRSKRYEKLDFLGEGQVRRDQDHKFSNPFLLPFYELDVPVGCLDVVKISLLLLSTKLCYAHTLAGNGNKDALRSCT